VVGPLLVTALAAHLAAIRRQVELQLPLVLVGTAQILQPLGKLAEMALLGPTARNVGEVEVVPTIRDTH
jgi:hypothetical protein